MADGEAENLTTPNFSSTENQLLEQLRKLAASLTPQDLDATLSTLKRIFDNIIQHPNNDKYRQIKLTSKTFSSKVWQYPAGQELMKVSGWIVKDDHVRLRDDSCVQIVSQLLGEKLEEENPAMSTYTLNISKSTTILGKRPRAESTITAADTGSSSEVPVLPEETQVAILDVVIRGDGVKLEKLLSQYNTSAHVKYIQIFQGPIISMAYFARQIGITRLLVNKYGVDVNISRNDGYPWFFKLFDGCDSTEACQHLIIQFVKEFNIDVHRQDYGHSFFHLAILHKLFTVIKFLVEECKVDVNCKSSTSVLRSGTPLHMAHGINEINIAQYLIEHGADQEAMDDDGRKPKDFQFSQYEKSYYNINSIYYLKRRAIFKNNISCESVYYQKFCDKGTEEFTAMDLTFEQFPHLKKFVDGGYVSWKTLGVSHALVNQQLLEATPTLNKLNRYITDMAPSYYHIGLELGIDNSQLNLIKEDHISFPGLEEKCRRMLEVWLNKNDTSTTWKKLCDTLEELGLNFLAGRIKDAIVKLQP